MRFLHIKSLISISVLSFLENMCPEEAEILYRLESYLRTVNPHTALVKAGKLQLDEKWREKNVVNRCLGFLGDHRVSYLA